MDSNNDLSDFVADAIYRGVGSRIIGDIDVFIDVILANILTSEHIAQAASAAAGHLAVSPPRAWTVPQIAALEGALAWARHWYEEDRAERYACTIALGLTGAVESLALRAAAETGMPLTDVVSRYWRSAEINDQRVREARAGK
jgi:hypothetical protein